MPARVQNVAKLKADAHGYILGPLRGREWTSRSTTLRPKGPTCDSAACRAGLRWRAHPLESPNGAKRFARSRTPPFQGRNDRCRPSNPGLRPGLAQVGLLGQAAECGPPLRGRTAVGGRVRFSGRMTRELSIYVGAVRSRSDGPQSGHRPSLPWRKIPPAKIFSELPQAIARQAVGARGGENSQADRDQTSHAPSVQ
jgi:hypothetical protein